MILGIVYSWSRTIPLDELEMYQFFAILSKPNTIKSYKIQGKNLLQLQHFLSWNKANIKHIGFNFCFLKPHILIC